MALFLFGVFWDATGQLIAITKESYSNSSDVLLVRILNTCDNTLTNAQLDN